MCHVTPVARHELGSAPGLLGRGHICLTLDYRYRVVVMTVNADDGNRQGHSSDGICPGVALGDGVGAATEEVRDRPAADTLRCTGAEIEDAGLRNDARHFHERCSTGSGRGEGRTPSSPDGKVSSGGMTDNDHLREVEVQFGEVVNRSCHILQCCGPPAPVADPSVFDVVRDPTSPDQVFGQGQSEGGVVGRPPESAVDDDCDPQPTSRRQPQFRVLIGMRPVCADHGGPCLVQPTAGGTRGCPRIRVRTRLRIFRRPSGVVTTSANTQ